jgi:nucleotide-binding universal stress UspA family protein
MDTAAHPNDILPGSIVVGVDGSEHANRAVRWAAEQAALEGRPLAVVHAAGEGDVRTAAAWTRAEGIGPDQLQVLLASARSFTQEAATQARSAHAGLTVRGVPLVGDPRQVLRDLSDVAHLVVLGSRGRGVIRSMLLGSVSASVAKHARCPVVVCRPGHPGAVKDGVLVGADGTAESLPVIEFAFRQASLRGLSLTVMHCFWEVAAAGAELARYDDSPDLRLLLSESVAGLSEKFPDVHVTLELARGLVDDCLTGGARPRDLIVVGRHPVASVSRFLSGSATTAVLERSGSTVAVVPEVDPTRIS